MSDNNKTLVDPMEFFDKQNYMLITVVEGTIDHPEFFKTHEEAHNAMCTYMAESMGEDKTYIKECYLAGEMVDNDAYISDKSAYFENDNHDNVDCVIFNTDECGVKVYKPITGNLYHKDEEESYMDMLNKLKDAISTDSIPENDKKKIDNCLFMLKEVLWKYSY